MKMKKYLIPIVITLLVLVAGLEGIYIFISRDGGAVINKCSDKIKYTGTSFLKS